MSNKTKDSRTTKKRLQVKDLAVSEKELTSQEKKKVKGGTAGTRPSVRPKPICMQG